MLLKGSFPTKDDAFNAVDWQVFANVADVDTVKDKGMCSHIQFALGNRDIMPRESQGICVGSFFQIAHFDNKYESKHLVWHLPGVN